MQDQTLNPAAAFREQLTPPPPSTTQIIDIKAHGFSRSEGQYKVNGILWRWPSSRLISYRRGWWTSEWSLEIPNEHAREILRYVADSRHWRPE